MKPKITYLIQFLSGLFSLVLLFPSNAVKLWVGVTYNIVPFYIYWNLVGLLWAVLLSLSLYRSSRLKDVKFAPWSTIVFYGLPIYLFLLFYYFPASDGGVLDWLWAIATSCHDKLYLLCDFIIALGLLYPLYKRMKGKKAHV